MSDAIEKPLAASADQIWHDRMRAAFGEGRTVADAPAQAGGLDVARLVTLRKTFDAVRVQPPEIAIRPLQDIASQLMVAEGAGATLGPAAIAFQREVDAEFDGVKGRAAGIAAGHVAVWNAAIENLPALPHPVATPEDRAARALAIQKLVADIEPGIARDSYMLRQVGAKTTALDGIAAQAAALKNDFKDLVPKRVAKGDPGKIDAAAKPAIAGALSTAEQAELNTALTSTQARMATDAQTDPAVVERAVALIAKGIDPVAAKASMQALKTWEAVKKKYNADLKINAEAAKAFMAQMWWYRRMAVDGEMTRLQKKYNFVWGSVGSDNPESDYDLTVRTHGKDGDKVKWDYAIVEEANAALSKDYGGVPPGIVFDTNLYAEAAAKPLTEEEAAKPEIKAMSAMKEQGQDVGALMKLRRFMDWDAYEDYKTEMLKGIAAPADKALVERQFEEADSLYFIARAEQLTKAAAGDAGKLAELAGIPSTPAGQKRLLELADAFEHDPGKSMAVNNAIYVEKLTDVREIEALYDAEKDVVAKAGLLARLKSLQADATFFAAEAYHSEGPLQHVVKAGQSSKLEIEGNGVVYDTPELKAAAVEAKKAEKLSMLSPNQMLQSFNENLGDLLKDLRHYAAEPFPGLGFYRSSKYIERLCDAFTIMVGKLPGPDADKLKAVMFGGAAPAKVQTRVMNLVDIRGEKKGFKQGDGPPIDPEQEKQAYAVEQMSAVFPTVATLPDLAKVATTFGQAVNAVVRNAITASMQALDSNPYFPKPK